MLCFWTCSDQTFWSCINTIAECGPRRVVYRWVLCTSLLLVVVSAGLPPRQILEDAMPLGDHIYSSAWALQPSALLSPSTSMRATLSESFLMALDHCDSSHWWKAALLCVVRGLTHSSFMPWREIWPHITSRLNPSCSVVFGFALLLLWHKPAEAENCISAQTSLLKNRTHGTQVLAFKNPCK